MALNTPLAPLKGGMSASSLETTYFPRYGVPPFRGARGVFSLLKGVCKGGVPPSKVNVRVYFQIIGKQFIMEFK